jgi:superfamily II DNA or RNA helicase
MRTGKSLPAKLWSEHPSRNTKAVIVCLKANKQQWVELCPSAIVVTKEEFKKRWKEFSDATALVIDEAHNFAAPLFITKKRSQLVEALYGLIKNNRNMHVLLLTGTPLTNDPASIHTLLTYVGHYRDWKEFQREFYTLEYKPFLPRPAFFPVKHWRHMANKLVMQYCDVVTLADCVESLPSFEDIVIKVKSDKKEYAEDEEYHWTKDHKHEQYAKLDAIKDLGNGYRKVILVCHYTEQIDYLADKLKNDKPVFVLDGRTKNQGQTIKDAQESPDAYLIVQAKIGMGWDGYMFDCLVFVSMAHRVIDHTQMKARLTNVDIPKPQVFYYMLGGRWDTHIYNSIMAGEDFSYERITRTTTEE